MNEPSRPPVRLLDQASSPLERALLNAGTSVHVSDATRAAVLDSLGLESRSHHRGALSLAKPRILTFRRGAFLLAAMVVSAAAVAVPIVRQRLAETPEVPRFDATELASPDVAVPAEPHAEDRPVESPLPVASTSPSPDVTKASRATDEPSAPRTGGHLSARNALAAELAALDAVRAKLNAGDPRGAQQLLDGYQRDFPRARMALEAEVLRIDALDRAGQSDAAKKRAQAFVQAHPKGVLTGRVRRYLEK